MKHYKVDVVFERLQTIAVEANSAEEAREIVAQGEFDLRQIVNTVDENAQIVSVTEKK